MKICLFVWVTFKLQARIFSTVWTTTFQRMSSCMLITWSKRNVFLFLRHAKPLAVTKITTRWKSFIWEWKEAINWEINLLCSSSLGSFTFSAQRFGAPFAAKVFECIYWKNGTELTIKKNFWSIWQDIIHKSHTPANNICST